VKRKNHAVHNEAACDYLLKSGEFNDWVVTTAFYSAMHYLQYELFPKTINGIKYLDFETYYDKEVKHKKIGINKHAAMSLLVSEHLLSAAPFYRQLLDSCWNARYKDYQISYIIAQKARENLTNLKSFLKKP